ncbi:hypothetical protein BGZ65_000174 [Modicella reniformis]|uniref:Uncharacterized protein n=1 Tax=Modicella reniformis TaxID=1440133 RepID=A0A9P6ILW6_9FUNG|nr:hypothetical protein BGZ65_000174 [Modicella reniformis]
MNAVPTIIVNGLSSSRSTSIPSSKGAQGHHTTRSGIDQQHLASAPPAARLRVAVVGSGLAGLSVAHLLSSLHTDNGHGEMGIDVHLFEKAHKLGKTMWQV